MLLLILGFILYASSNAVNKYMLEFMPVSAFIAFKLCFSATLYLLIFWQKIVSKNFLQKIYNQKFKLLTISLIGTCLPYFLKMYSFKFLKLSHALLIGSIDPFVTALYAHFLFSERLTRQKVIATTLGISAIGILFYMNFLELLENHYFVYGVIVAVLAVCIGRYGWILTQEILKKELIQCEESVFIFMLVGGLTSFFYSNFTISPLEYVRVFMNLKLLSLLFYSAVIGNIVFYTIYAYALKRHSINKVVFTGLVVPLAGHFFDWILLRHTLSHSFIVSFIMMLLAYILYFYPVRQTERLPT